MKYIKKHAWKFTFFTLVFLTLVFLNILFAPMMSNCSDLLISMISRNMNEPLKIYSIVGVILGSSELYICFLACLGLFISRQANFYYMVSFTIAVFLRFLLRMTFRSGRPFMAEDGVNPQYCLMSYGTPDSSALEFITIMIVILKNPKGSIGKKRRSSGIDTPQQTPEDIRK